MNNNYPKRTTKAPKIIKHPAGGYLFADAKGKVISHSKSYKAIRRLAEKYCQNHNCLEFDDMALDTVVYQACEQTSWHRASAIEALMAGSGLTRTDAENAVERCFDVNAEYPGGAYDE